MSYQVNRRIQDVNTPPIMEALSWLRPDDFGDEIPLIDLSQAVPNYPPPAAITDGLRRALDRPETAFYTDIKGIPPLREELAAHMGGADGNITAENVAITAGCNQAFSAVMQTLASVGDSVVMPMPWYFNHRMWFDTLGVRVNAVETDSSAIPDPSAIAAAIDDSTRAIVLCSPNNPTGAVYSPELIDEINTIARNASVALVVDETYRDFLATEDGGALTAHTLFDDPQWSDSFIQLYSFSKAYSLTGYRVGSIIAAPRFMNEVEKVLDCMTICPTAIGQQAALHGLRHGADFIARNRGVMAERLVSIEKEFAASNLNSTLVSTGAYFAYMRHPFRASSTDVAQHLATKFNLLTLPGSMFGPEQDDFLRVAFANVEASRFTDVIGRLADAEANFELK